MGSLTILQIVVAATMMFAGSTVLSTVGFGIGSTAAPVLLLVLDPQSVVVMINTVPLGLFAMIIFQNRRHLPIREMVPVGIAGLAGVPFGVFFLSSANESLLRISISTLIIIFTLVVAFNVRGPVPRSNLVGLLVGFVVGVLIASLGIGGPLIALFMIARDWSRYAIRGSLSLFFLLIESTSVVGYGVAGLFTPERIILILIVAVPVMLGLGLGTFLVHRMNERVFRRTIVVVILATSLLVLGREAFQL